MEGQPGKQVMNASRSHRSGNIFLAKSENSARILLNMPMQLLKSGESVISLSGVGNVYSSGN
jgi:hypothetical protein